MKVLGKSGRMALGAMEFGFLLMDSFVSAAFKSAFCHEVPDCIARPSPGTELGPASPSSYLPKVSYLLNLESFPGEGPSSPCVLSASEKSPPDTWVWP